MRLTIHRYFLPEGEYNRSLVFKRTNSSQMRAFGGEKSANGNGKEILLDKVKKGFHDE